MLNIVFSLHAWRKQLQLALINVYSGRAFILADVASLTARILGLPIILMLHGGNLPAFVRRHPMWAERVLSRGDGFVAPSLYLAQAFNPLCKFRVIPNLIQLDSYPYRPRRHLQPRLLWMRTFEKVYHPQMAVKVLSLLKGNFPSAHLTMAGQDQGELGPTRELAKACGLENDVRFVGFLDLAGKQREFDEHDIFLNTNRMDNMPVSLLEVAGSGLPIVSTRVGGIPYMLSDEETALLVENQDIEGMATSVQRLLTDPSMAMKLSLNGRKMAESCTWPNIRVQWESLFDEIIQEKAGSYP